MIVASGHRGAPPFAIYVNEYWWFPRLPTAQFSAPKLLQLLATIFGMIEQLQRLQARHSLASASECGPHQLAAVIFAFRRRSIWAEVQVTSIIWARRTTRTTTAIMVMIAADKSVPENQICAKPKKHAKYSASNCGRGTHCRVARSEDRDRDSGDNVLRLPYAITFCYFAGRWSCGGPETGQQILFWETVSGGKVTGWSSFSRMVIVNALE